MYVCGECGTAYDRGGFCSADGAALGVSDDPLLGTEVLRYRIARAIGEGATGKVFLAVHPTIGSRVAIKILTAQCANRPDLLERFFAEGRAVNLIRHEHIISVIDMARLPDGRPLIVMEFIDGTTLATCVRNGQAPLGGVVRVMTEVLSALQAAHAIGIIHRDLKPDNIMITAQGHAKVLDFGIAKLAPGLTEVVSQRTRTGMLLGTPTYMAPEQITGTSDLDARADVYAAGIVLFEAVTGKVPFTGATMYDLMHAHVDEPPPSPRSLRPDLPLGLEQVILTALAKRPEHRFQSAAAMAHALDHAAADLPSDQWRDVATRRSRMSIRPSGRAPGRSRDRSPEPPTARTQPPTARTAPATAPDRPSHGTVRDGSPPAHSVTQLPAHAPRRRGPIVLAVAVAGVLAIGATVIALRGREDRSPTAAVPSAAPIAAAPVAPSLAGDAPRLGTPTTATPAAAQTATQPATTAAAQTATPTAAPTPTTTTPTTAPTSTAVAEKPEVPSPSPSRAPTSTAAPSRRPIAPIAAAPRPPRTPAPSSAPVPAPAAPAATTTPPANPTKDAPWISRPTYDAKRFDHRAFVRKAQALARQLLDDALLVELDLYEVYPDGHIDLTQATGDHVTQFVFRSEKARDGTCAVIVDVYPNRVATYLAPGRTCQQRFTAAPRCPLAWVWEQARAKGTQAGHGGINFAHDRWQFMASDLWWTFEEDCPP